MLTMIFIMRRIVSRHRFYHNIFSRLNDFLLLGCGIHDSRRVRRSLAVPLFDEDK